jgi:hypothetical protein
LLPYLVGVAWLVFLDRFVDEPRVGEHDAYDDDDRERHREQQRACEHFDVSVSHLDADDVQHCLVFVRSLVECTVCQGERDAYDAEVDEQERHEAFPLLSRRGIYENSALYPSDARERNGTRL